MQPYLRDHMLRYQQTALRETGRRPITWVCGDLDADLFLRGANHPGYACWQPIAWPEGQPDLGALEDSFDASIIDYLSMCQFLEMRFMLPVANAASPLSFCYRRVFETPRNTLSSPPRQALEEALFLGRMHPERPTAYCMAATCDAGDPLLLMLQASDGQAFIMKGAEDEHPLFLKTRPERLLPQLIFVYL